MTHDHLRIGTRKSALALAQAGMVRDALLSAWPGMQAELVPMLTTGDKLKGPLTEEGGKGLFTKELEEALFEQKVDIAVHSVKDMQTVLPDGLILGCVMKREDARDRLVGEGLTSFDDIPKGATLGTSSLRRSAQALLLRPDLKIVHLRGNVDTRLEKIRRGEARATLLAQAGLNRLGISAPGIVLDTDIMLPAVAQGALGIECRAGDTKILELLAPLSHRETETAVCCERAFLRALDGSCRTPIAGYATVEKGRIHLQGMILRPDGSTHHRTDVQGNADDAEKIGFEEGRALLARAGKDFLK